MKFSLAKTFMNGFGLSSFRLYIMVLQGPRVNRWVVILWYHWGGAESFGRGAGWKGGGKLLGWERVL